MDNEWTAAEVASHDAWMAKKCECTYLYGANCEEGHRLLAAVDAAQQAWQQSPLSDGTQKLVELHDKYSACLRAYSEHVKACSINA